MTLAPTPGQTVGPVLRLRAAVRRRQRAGPARPPRARSGCTAGSSTAPAQPVPDALLEIWQADADGAVVPQEPGRCAATATRSPAGAGRPPTTTGRYTFTTSRPGAPTPGAAPFFAMTVFARGLLNRLFTRAYLPDDAAALEADPLLSSLDPERRETLVARPDERRLRLRHPAAGRRARRSSSATRGTQTEPMTDLFWPGDERAGDHLDRRGAAARDGRGRDRLARGARRRRASRRPAARPTTWPAW